jgi:hypothetical protein
MKEAQAARLKRRRQWLRQYRRTAKGKMATRRSNEKYRKSEKGKAANARYAASARGKVTRARYLTSAKRKAVVACYRASPKGKEAIRRGNEKYRRAKKANAAPKRPKERRTVSKGKKTMRRQYAKRI